MKDEEDLRKTERQREREMVGKRISRPKAQLEQRRKMGKASASSETGMGIACIDQRE